jgi:hypothetical protein
MSDTLNSAMDKLPDVWFDWYARLLPGTLGVLCFESAGGNLVDVPDAGRIPAILLIGYLVGHILQPLVGFITKFVERLLGKETKYAKAKLNKQMNPILTTKVSKAHAEANSMLACAIVLALNAWFWHSTIATVSSGYLIVALTCLLGFIERVYARSRKIEDLTVS